MAVQRALNAGAEGEGVEQGIMSGTVYRHSGVGSGDKPPLPLTDTGCTVAGPCTSLRVVQWSSGESLRSAFESQLSFLYTCSVTSLPKLYIFFCLWLHRLWCIVCITRLKTSLILNIDSLTSFILTSGCLLTGSTATRNITGCPCLGFRQHQPSSSDCLFLVSS